MSKNKKIPLLNFPCGPVQPDSSRIWFAVRVHSQFWERAAVLMRVRGLTVFTPTEVKLRRKSRHAKKKEPVLYPMMIGYVFVASDNKFSWARLFSLKCVTGVVGFDGAPRPIRDENMMKLIDQSGQNIPYRRTQNPHKAVRAGEKAQISFGPFAGQIVEIKDLKGQRAKILLELFGALKEIEIQVSNLEAA